MRPDSPLRLFVVGVGAFYLALLVGLTIAFADDVPPAAWVGFAVVTCVVAALVLAAIGLFERIDRDAGTDAAAALATADDGRRRVLVVADVGCDGKEACGRLLSTIARGSSPEVFVVAPTIASPLHHMTDDEGRERTTAGRRLDEIILLLKEERIEAHGMVGSDLPLEAIQDALAVFPASEIVVLAPPGESSAWSERDLVERTRSTYARPVTHVALPRAA
jgi:hypothetical protein